MSWLVEPDVVVRASARAAGELGVDPKVNVVAVRVALREADHLADDIYDVPGALLFAFGRTSRCFASFRALSVFWVDWHAKRLGFKLEAAPSDLAAVLVRVALREMSYEDVRVWTAERLLPFGG